MNDRPRLVVHERRGSWARQLRPRAAAWRIRMVETRSADDLEKALRGETHALIVCDLGDRPASGLDDLGRGMLAAPTSLALVLEPGRREEVATLARELGATLVLSGQVVPPVVVDVVTRWRRIAEARIAREGWLRDEADGDDPLADLLAGIIPDKRSSTTASIHPTD